MHTESGPTSSYMKSGSELLAKRSVLIRVCSENTWLRKASPKGGSIPLTLGYNKIDRESYHKEKHIIKKSIFFTSIKHEYCYFIQLSELVLYLHLEGIYLTD